MTGSVTGCSTAVVGHADHTHVRGRGPGRDSDGHGDPGRGALGEHDPDCHSVGHPHPHRDVDPDPHPDPGRDLDPYPGREPDSVSEHGTGLSFSA